VAGRCSGRDEAAWRARKRTRGEELEGWPAWRRCVGATRVENGAGRAAATVSGGGGRERGQLGRTAERRGVLGESQQRGAKAVGEHGGGTWSGAGAGVASGGVATSAGGGAVARQRRGAEEEEGEGRQGLICSFQGPQCKSKFPTNLKFK
jgi:hypothetical protein